MELDSREKNSIFVYRWNQVKQKWQFFSYATMKWQNSVDYRYKRKQDVPDFTILKYKNTWCEPEMEERNYEIAR